MKTRFFRLALAVALLAAVFHPLAALLGGALAAVAGPIAAHPAVLVAAVATVLLCGAVPGPVDRALTRLAAPPRHR